MEFVSPFARCFEPNQRGLAVKHDGRQGALDILDVLMCFQMSSHPPARRFTALDVLGLSSVGLSTKAVVVGSDSGCFFLCCR